MAPILVLIGVATGALTGLTGASGMSVLISALLLAGVEVQRPSLGRRGATPGADRRKRRAERRRRRGRFGQGFAWGLFLGRRSEVSGGGLAVANQAGDVLERVGLIHQAAFRYG